MFEEERCFRCERTGEEVRLFDAISGEEVIKICESCSALEDIPIIKKPTSFQLKEAERPHTVYERLARAAGLHDKAKEAKEKIIEKETAKIIAKGITLDNLRKPRDFRKIGDATIDIIKADKPLNLIDNYNWYIQRARRARGLTTKQFADMLGESEITVKMIERAELPGDYERVIRKIQQFLGIGLEKGRMLKKEPAVSKEIMPVRKEETVKIIENEEIKPVEVPKQKRDLRFDTKSAKGLTIYDLHKAKEAREKEEREKRIQDEIERGGMKAIETQEVSSPETSAYEEKRSMGFFKRLFSRKKSENEIAEERAKEIQEEE